MDDPMPSTPAKDTILDETDNSIESKPNPKYDSVFLAQSAMDTPVTPSFPSIKFLNVENPLA